MASKLSIQSKGILHRFVGGENIFAPTERVREIYVNKNNTKYLVWQYDITAPVITVDNYSMEEGKYSLVIKDKITITGKYIETESGIKTILVDGKEATIVDDTFSCELIFTQNGEQVFDIVATDNAGNVSTEHLYIEKITKTVPYPDRWNVTGDNAFIISSDELNCNARGYVEQQTGEAYLAIYSTCNCTITNCIPTGAKSVTATGNGAGNRGSSGSVSIVRADGRKVFERSTTSAVTIDLETNYWNNECYYLVVSGTGSDGNYGYTISAGYASAAFVK